MTSNTHDPLTPRKSSSPRAATSDLFHIAFYKFMHLSDPQATAEALRTLTQALKGSILVAAEGINGMLAGSDAALAAFTQALERGPQFNGAFAGMVYKRTVCQAAPFGRMKVHLKKEIVPLGIEGVDATGDVGVCLSPQAWRELIARDDVVVIDNRNSFEFNMGRFAGAIDPQVENFRDFPQYLMDHLPQWQAEGKKVAMYCTGGIRCEKTGAWMAQQGVPIYQLDGGILNYFAQMPDAQKDWEGDCFVFDNRVALNTRLEESGASLEDAYAGDPAMLWRLERARRLAQAQEEPAAPPQASAS